MHGSQIGFCTKMSSSLILFPSTLLFHPYIIANGNGLPSAKRPGTDSTSICPNPSASIRMYVHLRLHALVRDPVNWTMGQAQKSYMTYSRSHCQQLEEPSPPGTQQAPNTSMALTSQSGLPRSSHDALQWEAV